MEASPRPSIFPGRHLALALVALAGASLAAWSFQDARDRDMERINAEFIRRTAIRHALIREVLGRYEDSLFGLSTLFMVDEKVSPAEFHQATQRLNERTPGALAIEWVAEISDAQRSALEEELGQNHGRGPVRLTEMTAEGRAIPAGRRASYLPIVYVEPLAGNESALGLDLKAGRTNDALQLARETRRITLTRQVALVQAPRDQQGLIMISPVWRPVARGASLEPGVFQGYVQAVFLAHDLLERTGSSQPDTLLDMLFIDASETDPARQVLYHRTADPKARGATAPSLTEFRSGMAQELALPIGGRNWHVLYRPRAGWIEEQFSPLPWVRTTGVLALTLLAAGLVQAVSRRAELVKSEVLARTEELRRTQKELEGDIRRRQAAEEALKASENRLQAILDHNPNSIFVKDLAGRYVLVNREHARLWRKPARDFIGRTDEELFSAEVAARFRVADAQVLSSQTVLREEFTITLPGADRPTTSIVQKFALRDAEGRVHGLCGISTDITDRKDSEQEKLSIERKALAAQKLESLGVLAGGIAHDFNNILTSVLANATLARQEAAAGRPIDRNLQQIEQAARRAADLCQQMLAYAGKGKLTTERIDLSELVRGTTALLEVSLRKNVRLDLQLAPDLPPVLADPTQLRQIVMNLVINAGDAITGPSGSITVRTFARTVDAALLRSALGTPELPTGLYTGLEVQDDGCGMTPETIARIFEPFFTTKFSGRGLGLSAVLGIVQGHRGALFVESTPGQGSVFRLLLPATQGAAVASAPPFAFAGLPTPLRGTALVVDDEDAVRIVAATVLETNGAQIFTAANGEEALEILRTHGARISVVLLDLTMPGIGGEETLRRMRAAQANQPVVLMSGYSEAETMQRCAPFGTVRFIQKPFEVGTLLAAARPFLS